MDEISKFLKEKELNIKKQASKRFLGKEFLTQVSDQKYSHNFSWLGRPIIQVPQDIIALQEIIWEVKPDLIIETGIAHGGSLIFSASILTLLEICGEIKDGKILGIDIDIRAHNKKAIQDHPLSNKITMIEGSSIDKSIIEQVHQFAQQGNKILLCLDSNHTHEHVLKELRAYSSLVSIDSYCIVFDTAIEDLPKNSFPNRPWDKGNNPKTAVKEFLKTNKDFEIDHSIDNKLLISVAPEGYLKRIKKT